MLLTLVLQEAERSLRNFEVLRRVPDVTVETREKREQRGTREKREKSKQMEQSEK